jgi:hypothetical protein
MQKTLKMAMAGEAAAQDAKYQTGIIIDLTAPEGNFFCIMGICKKLFQQFGESEEWAGFYKQCLGEDYKSALALARQWFGFIYINEGE